MFKAFAAAIYLRRISRDLAALGTALTRQNDLLTRLADRYAPADPPTERALVSADTGLSHLDAAEAAVALDYVSRTQRDTGHIPDDEEVLIYLADEKTTDLHKRLIEREAQLTRLAEDRR